MTREVYQEAIKETNKYVILTDHSKILRVFDTPEDAEDYFMNRMKRTPFNKFDLYITTGKPTSLLDGITVRDDIKPFKNLHIGKNW